MNGNETEPRHIHPYLGELDAAGVHLHLHLGTSGDGDGDGTATGPVIEPTVEASLSRLKSWDPSNAENIQAAYDGLVRLGLTPHPARTRSPGTKAQPYIRWTHPRHPGGSVAYLNAASLCS